MAETDYLIFAKASSINRAESHDLGFPDKIPDGKWDKGQGTLTLRSITCSQFLETVC